MPKYITIEGEVDQLMLQKFIDIPNEPVVVFFTTNGGATNIWENIVEIINSLDDIELVWTDELSSCGFSIFFNAKCKKRITDNCVGMTHMGVFSSYINPYSIKKPQWGTKVKLMNIKHFFKKEVKFYKKELWMWKSDIKAYKENYDVHFTAKRLRKFISNQK